MRKRLTIIGCMLSIGMIVGLTSCQDELLSKEDQRSVPALEEARDLIVMNSMTISYTWNGQGSDSEHCDKVGEGEEGQRPPTGWMHWLLNNKGASTEAELVLSRGGTVLGTYEPQAPLGAANWHFYTPFFEIFEGDVITLEATVYLNGTAATPTLVVLSDYCPGVEKEELTVTKTVVTSYVREHFWDITKKVETEKNHKLNGYSKIWLYADGTGNETATWEVDVTYVRSEDSGWNISGEVTITNTGSLDAVITSISDVLAGTTVTLNCGVTFPYTLAVGATLTCSYSDDGYKTGNNVVTVTTERDTYSDTKPIIWGAPTTEVNKTVNISDISDLFGTVGLGTATAPNNAKFPYSKAFAWADYGQDNCGSFQYDNTAKIVETNQSASASLKVNVQCFVYETAYAKAEGNDALCFIPTFNNWGWTNEVSAPTKMRLYAGAGRCIGGTDVGHVEVNFNGSVTVDFKIDSPYGLKETHVYAGNTEFPQVKRGRNTVSTVAPGQYYIESPLAFPFWVIAHAVVGLPDPKFGPK